MVPADALPDDPSTLKAMLIAERAQNERLRQIIKELQRHRFGRRAETLPEDQMLLRLEEVEQVAASGEAETEATNPAERASRSAKRRMNRVIATHFATSTSDDADNPGLVNVDPSQVCSAGKLTRWREAIRNLNDDPRHHLESRP
jgi:hypothetical protein